MKPYFRMVNVRRREHRKVLRWLRCLVAISLEELSGIIQNIVNNSQEITNNFRSNIEKFGSYLESDKTRTETE